MQLSGFATNQPPQPLYNRSARVLHALATSSAAARSAAASCGPGSNMVTSSSSAAPGNAARRARARRGHRPAAARCGRRAARFGRLGSALNTTPHAYRNSNEVASGGPVAPVHPQSARQALEGGSVTARALTGQRQRVIVQPVIDEHAALAEPCVLAVHVASPRLHIVRRQLPPIVPTPQGCGPTIRVLHTLWCTWPPGRSMRPYLGSALHGIVQRLSRLECENMLWGAAEAAWRRPLMQWWLATRGTGGRQRLRHDHRAARSSRHTNRHTPVTI